MTQNIQYLTFRFVDSGRMNKLNTITFKNTRIQDMVNIITYIYISSIYFNFGGNFFTTISNLKDITPKLTFIRGDKRVCSLLFYNGVFSLFIWWLVYGDFYELPLAFQIRIATRWVSLSLIESWTLGQINANLGLKCLTWSFKPALPVFYDD